MGTIISLTFMGPDEFYRANTKKELHDLERVLKAAYAAGFFYAASDPTPYDVAERAAQEWWDVLAEEFRKDAEDSDGNT